MTVADAVSVSMGSGHLGQWIGNEGLQNLGHFIKVLELLLVKVWRHLYEIMKKLYNT